VKMFGVGRFGAQHIFLRPRMMFGSILQWLRGIANESCRDGSEMPLAQSCLEKFISTSHAWRSHGAISKKTWSLIGEADAYYKLGGYLYARARKDEEAESFGSVRLRSTHVHGAYIMMGKVLEKKGEAAWP